MQSSERMPSGRMSSSNRCFLFRGAFDMNRCSIIAFLSAWVASAAFAADRGSPCLIEPFQRISLKSSVAAQITSIAVDRGAVVRKSQVLATLDASVEQASLELAKYRSTMQSQVRSAESKLANAQTRFKRRDELVEQRYVSAQDRDDAAADALIAEADLQEARDNRELARLEAARLSAELNRRTLVSPINGVVTERLQNPGDTAQIGDAATPILKLAQIDPARVEMFLPLAKYGRIRPGDVIHIRPEPPFTGSYAAVVKVVDKVVDAASGTVGIRLEIPNPRGDVPLGVKCSASV